MRRSVKRTALRVAVASGYLGRDTVAEALRTIDRLQGMLWKLVR